MHSYYKEVIIQISRDEFGTFSAKNLANIALQNDVIVTIKQAIQIMRVVNECTAYPCYDFINDVAITINQLNYFNNDSHKVNHDILVYIDFVGSNVLLNSRCHYMLGKQGKPFKFTKNYNKNYNITIVPTFC